MNILSPTDQNIKLNRYLVADTLHLKTKSSDLWLSSSVETSFECPKQIIIGYILKMQDSQEDLAFLWSSCRLTDADSCQHLVHHGPTECATAFFQKLIDTGRAAGKLYILFHVIPFLMRLRKIRTAGELGKLVLRTLKEYGRSLLFMSMLVGLLRGMLCFNWNLPPKRIIRPWIAINAYMSPLSAVSILFEDSSRRSEVVYHVCAKALRSVYIMVKRLGRLEWECEGKVMHIVIMGLLYYVYNHRPSVLKFRNVFELIFGNN